MAKILTDKNHVPKELSDQAPAQHPRAGAASEDLACQEQTIESIGAELAGEEIVAEVLVPEPIPVRETRRLYRLKAARFVALVAADTEEEARMLAAIHDALRGDWRNPQFASAEFEETGEAHVFGDVIISARAASPAMRSRRG